MKYIVLCFSVLIVGLDQLFKKLAIDYLSTVMTYPVIEDFFHLTYLENKGAAFGIFSGKSFFLITLTLAVILLAVFAIITNKIKGNFLLWSSALILGGGIGNLIDRIVRGYVVDYLDFRVIQFAVFNFADCCVVVGTILIMIYILFLDKNQSLITKKSKSGVNNAE